MRSTRCAMVFFDTDTKTFSGWRAWNPHHDAGTAGSDETTPEKVSKLADDRMYVDKEHYYQQITKDPDSRNDPPAANP